MTRRLRNALLASTALAFAAVTVAACGTPSQYSHSKDSYGQTKVSNNKTYASPTVVSTLPPAGSTTYVAPAQQQTTTTYVQPGTTYVQPGTTYVQPGTTYVQPGTTYVQPGTTTYVQPTYAQPTTTTVYAPATTVNTVGVRTVGVDSLGRTVLVPQNQVAVSTTVANDVDFMSRASQFNATEIAMSRIAYQRAQSADVRQFAQNVITTHRRMSDNLDAIALRRNVSLAWTPSPAGSRAVDKLSGMSGSEFDRYYLAQIIADHDAGVALYSGQGTVATDVTLRSTAGADAVELRNRRDEAIRLQNGVY
jgi:putative membrane protein